MKIDLKHRKVRQGGFGGVIAGAVVGAATLAYGAYSAANPPKSPKQANAQIVADNAKLAKLNAQLAAAKAAGKDPSKIQTQIADLNTQIGYLNQYIASSGNNPANGTPVGSPASSPGQTNSGLIIGGVGVAALIIGGAYLLTKKKRI